MIKKDKETYGVVPIELEVIMFVFLRGCYLNRLNYVIKDFGEIELFFKDITIGDLGRFYSEHIDSFSGVNYSKIYNSICMNDSYSDMSVYDFICSKLEGGIIYSEMEVSFSERFSHKANLEIWIGDVCSMMFVNKKKGNH